MTEKYLDFSFEKTNSAYMLFYERRLPDHLKEKHAHLLASPTNTTLTKLITTEKSANFADQAVQEKKTAKWDSNSEVNKKMEVNIEYNDANKTNIANCDNKTENEEVKEKDKDMEKEEKVKEIEKAKERIKENVKEAVTVKDHDKDKFKKFEQETETPSTSTGSSSTMLTTTTAKQLENPWRPQLSKELEDWIWQDNRQFLQDRNIFEHTYFK